MATAKKTTRKKTTAASSVLSKLEKHEAECNLRYQRIEERLDDHKSSLKALDVKLWALAVLILIALFVQRFLG